MWLASARFEREGGCKCNSVSAKSVKWQLSKKRACAVVLPKAGQAQLVAVRFAAAGAIGEHALVTLALLVLTRPDWFPVEALRRCG